MAAVPGRPYDTTSGSRLSASMPGLGRAKGDRIINEHDERPAGPERGLYIVTTGRAVFRLDGERREAPAGTYVFVEPAVKRTAFAEEPGTTIVSVGGVQGEAYEPSGWEVWSPVKTSTRRVNTRR